MTLALDASYHDRPSEGANPPESPLAGLLNLSKPKGMTSHDVVNQVRRALGLKKVGHLGTLDPFAEGVLPVCVGVDTRLIEYFPSDKAYRATLVFGQASNTLDCDGILTDDSPPLPENFSETALKSILPRFIGTLEQTVPLFSAVKVAGKKLYHYAHAGKTPPVPLPSKMVTISHLALVSYDPGQYPQAILDVECSSGTYIRALARDIAEALGTVAHLKALVRTRHGRLTLDEATPLADFCQAKAPSTLLKNPVSALRLPQVKLSELNRAVALQYGQKISYLADETDGHIKREALAVLVFDDSWVAIARREGEHWAPEKVCATPVNIPEE
ncbi:MAG: tRNA pseudouridine(55) synthase TruB [Vampirovibrionales bacterium]|nr:tRNA pseudouridine(55) synthase TruB [Vampirovibrionales bacterium]